ncbi:hypothetical protein MNBD_NITROSPINAE02-525 [hydrothermal vent metagenome]|uniref:NAD-dependent epimerase/dehydratase domain-containing protein n=1 Tax=hydrothermal vent metagenome TaxID=652676 RepID=A0A3B1CG77_9ZZZZ
MGIVEEKNKSVIVTGARSQIGYYLLPRLIDSGYKVFAITRAQADERFLKSPSLTWVRLDIGKNGFNGFGSGDAVNYIHIAPLPLLPALVESLHRLGVTRIIAFGSTSRYSKINSSSNRERAYAKALASSEEELAKKHHQLGVDWTIFRPTLIYGCGMDKNITTIANTIRKYGMFPVVGEGKGKRQPVHADDLAMACVRSINHPSTYNRAYNLSGGETLTYGEMVNRIFDGLCKKRRRIKIPLPLFRAALKVISFLPKYNYVTEEMADRINDDLCFDHSDATNDFGFSPRGFSFDKEFIK